MKKFLTMLMVASIFSLVACGPTDEETAANQAEADALVNEMIEGSEEVAEDVVAEDVVAEEVVAEEVAVEGEEATEEDAHEHAEGEEHSH
jgi:ABC-type Zn uptake system ZnuABC Zn-binding protein ZnuA